MYDQLYFTTDFFKRIVHENSINPECDGESLAKWLAISLEEEGVKTEGIYQEDFGWIVMISRKPCMLWLGCNNIEETDNEWSIFCVVEPSLLQKLFQKIDVKFESEKLKHQLIKIIPKIPRATNIYWNK